MGIMNRVALENLEPDNSSGSAKVDDICFSEYASFLPCFVIASNAVYGEEWNISHFVKICNHHTPA